MAKNQVFEKGRYMPWTNGTASDVNSGEVVPFDDMIGIALVDIPVGASGNLDTEGVYELDKKAATAMNQGENAYWEIAGGEISVTDTDVPAGKIFNAPDAADTKVYVKLNS